MMNFLNTFRGRLLVILAFLLIATLGVQFYLNYRTEEQNKSSREMQEQALVAGIALGANSLTSGSRLSEFVRVAQSELPQPPANNSPQNNSPSNARPGNASSVPNEVRREGQTFFDTKSIRRIEEIIIIDPDGDIYDTLSSRYIPEKQENGEKKYFTLKDVENLPPIMQRDRLGEDAAKFPNANLSEEDVEGEAHVVPLETDQGRYYVMVMLKTDRGKALRRAAQPLIYTLLVLLFSTIVTVILVWRFTRPIANLSKAAREVGLGNLSVRVQDARRTDEIGELAAQFNEMTAELAKTRELEAQLQEAEKSAVVGRLGSAIAHEIRNPLNYINLTLDHLRAKFAPADAAQKADFDKLTSQLKAEVERINNQISDFLNYSRPANADLTPTDVRKVIENSLKIVEPQAEEQNIRISLIEHENVSRILGDAEFLRSVFNNLFINAVQAMETTGGNLQVIISPEENFVRIDIADTGAGIPEENLSKIFQPYFSTKETGTGLGLAIVKKVVDIHNGTIEVESKTGEGTKFIVKLPKATE